MSLRFPYSIVVYDLRSDDEISIRNSYLYTNFIHNVNYNNNFEIIGAESIKHRKQKFNNNLQF